MKSIFCTLHLPLLNKNDHIPTWPLGPLFRPFPRAPKRHVSPVLARVKHFQAQACPPAKGPDVQMKAAVKTTSAKSISPVMASLAKAARAPAFPYAPVSGLRKRAAVSSPPYVVLYITQACNMQVTFW
jgi:hypothetical protein